MIDRGVVKAKLIDQMNMNRSTFYRKIKYPGTFLITEVKELSEILECDYVYLMELLINQRP